MLPLVGIPATVVQGMQPYRQVFCRQEGFNHVNRYVSGLLLSPNKTLQGIYSQLVFAEGEQVSRRAMHEAVFEAGWDLSLMMSTHRAEVSSQHHGRGYEVISLDWTLSHHDYSEQIYGAKRAYDYVDGRMSTYQTVVTAAVANPTRIDGLSVDVQQPNYQKEELSYLEVTAQDSYEQMEQVNQRLEELLHYQKNRLAYRKRTEIAVEIVAQIEAEGNFPHAHYAFDNGVLSRPLTKLIEQQGKHWVSEIECSRHILWNDLWQRVDEVAAFLGSEHPESFRCVQVLSRNGKVQKYWAFTKCVRLKKYGRKRLVIVHEREDLSDAPRYLVTDARYWDATRVIKTWKYRWSVEVFHEFCKEVTGFESSQVRKEEAVKRHFALSCVAQSFLQNVTGTGRKSERFNFAKGTQTVGQKLHRITREALEQLLKLSQNLFMQGHTSDQVLEVLMPT